MPDQVRADASGRDRKVPLYAAAYEKLKSLIISGTLKPNEVLGEAQLATELGMSRTPIREAIRRLAGEGFLESVPQVGVRVHAPSPKDIAETYVARAMVEGFAARLACMSLSESDLNNLEAIVEGCESAAASHDIERATELNSEFHAAIVGGARNERLRQILVQLSPVIVRYRRFSLHFPDHLERSTAEHRQLLQYLRGCRPDEVEVAMRSHILRAASRVVRAVEALEGSSLAADDPAMRVIAEYMDLDVFGQFGSRGGRE